MFLSRSCPHSCMTERSRAFLVLIFLAVMFYNLVGAESWGWMWLAAACPASFSLGSALL